jgi:hypothetical protein
MERIVETPNWKAATLSGIIAGAVFLILALVMVPFVLGGSPWALPRMIAAIVMGEGVLTPVTFDLGIVAAAVGVHFVLSLVYACFFASFLGRTQLGPALLAGIGGGVLLYVVNFYGFTVLFPWFVAARNWVTIADHLVFGVVTAWCYVTMSRPHAREETGKAPSMKQKHA